MGSFLFTLAHPLFAQEAPAADPAPPVAEKSLDELLDLPEQAPDSKPTSPDGRIADEETTEPFALAVEGMKQAADRLGQASDASLDTQRIQQQVVNRLDRLISDLRKQSQSQGKSQQRQKDSGSQEQKPGEQQAEGQEQGGSEGAVQTRLQGQVQDPQTPDQPLKEQMAEWGNLPERLRDQLRQGRDDRYSDLYKVITQQYYRRLAEEAQP